MNGEFTTEEREILIECLENDVADLHTEIMHTDNYEFKERLKTKRALLKKILEALKGFE